MHLLYTRSGRAATELHDHDLVELYRHPAPADRAWVRTNFVCSLDGSIQGPDGRSGSINTPSDHHLFALHRALADAVLVGAQTVRAEGYRAVDLAVWQRELRRSEGLSDFPRLVIITGSLQLDPAVVVDDADHGPVSIMTTDRPTAAELEPFVDAGAEVVRAGRDRVELAQVLGHLVASGRPRVLCEGGPRLHRDLLAADLVDELSTTTAATVVGGEGQRSTSGPPIPGLPAFMLQQVLFAPDDQTLFTSYRRAR